MPVVRRYRYNAARDQVVEVPLTPELTIVPGQFEVGGVNCRMNAVIEAIDLYAQHLQHHQPLWFGEDHAEPVFIQPVPHPVRVAQEARLELFGMLAQVLERRTDAPGTEAGCDDLETTLVDLARTGSKEDFYFLARASGGVKAGQLDELWVGTRRRLKLEP